MTDQQTPDLKEAIRQLNDLHPFWGNDKKLKAIFKPIIQAALSHPAPTSGNGGRDDLECIASTRCKKTGSPTPCDEGCSTHPAPVIDELEKAIRKVEAHFRDEDGTVYGWAKPVTEAARLYAQGHRAGGE